MKVAAVAISLCLGSLSAWADKDAGQKHFDAGVALAKRGEHRAAIGEFELAYAAAGPLPGVLYNLGYVHLAIADAEPAAEGDVRQSIDYFQRYLAVREQAPNRAEVEGFIAALKERLDPTRPQRTPQARVPRVRPEEQLRSADRAHVERGPVGQKPRHDGRAGGRAQQL